MQSSLNRSLTELELIQRKKEMVKKTIKAAEWWAERAEKNKPVLQADGRPITLVEAQAIIDEAQVRLQTLIFEERMLLHLQAAMKRPPQREAGGPGETRTRKVHGF